MLGLILWVGYETMSFDILVYSGHFSPIAATQYLVKVGHT